jgi:hypothetical protein
VQVYREIVLALLAETLSVYLMENVENNFIDDSGIVHLNLGNWPFLERLKLSIFYDI